VSALLVAVGGAAGSVLRYWMSGGVQRSMAATGVWALFPAGTFAVNVLGCLIAGALAEIAERRGALTPEARALLMVGFLGGFTTFSTFANETVAVWRSGAVVVAVANVALSVVSGVVAVVVGRSVIAVIVK
jgi:fluoride exporter